MVGEINVGRRRILFTAYNPRDALSLLYCRYVVHGMLADVSEADVHAWLREHVPDCVPLLDAVEAGQPLPSEVRNLNELPVTPGDERNELRIVAWLRREALAQRATS